MTKTQILVVEDEGIVAKDLQSMLRRLGYSVPTTVGTGPLAVHTALENRPDLILMDIQLRGSMDGVQAAAAINAQQDVPIVYLTANSDEPTLQRAKETAPFGFLVKPFEERAIQAGIEMALYKFRTDKRVREREQWLSTTLSSIADAVITTDAEGKVTFLNAAAEKVVGWSCAAALGLLYSEVFSLVEEGSKEQKRDGVWESLRNGVTLGAESSSLLLRRDGSEIHVEHTVAPIRQGLEQIIDGCVIVFSDVTSRKRLEEQLRHVQKMDAVGKLAGSIAHDFNNALTAIMGYAEIIVLQSSDEDLHHGDAKQIVRAAEHSARLTQQLLAFSRKQILQFRCLDLQEELQSVQGMVRRLIGESVSLTMDVPEGLWNIKADSGQIQQVILNLAINARDAMPTGGELRLQAANVTLTMNDARRINEGRPGDFLLLTVSDTGTGMSQETANRIFEPFFTTKGEGKGTGLGLATCYEIMKKCSGVIDVSSVLGLGTTFSLYFPKSEETAPATVKLENTLEMPRGTETILVLEDEEFVRELTVQVLQGLGYFVIAAEDGTDAVRILTSSSNPSIDLIITDIGMPRMSGREFLRWFGSNVGNTRVLLMSGYTDDEVIKNAVEGAEVDYIQKPFSPNTLAWKVRDVFSRSEIALRSEVRELSV